MFKSITKVFSVLLLTVLAFTGLVETTTAQYPTVPESLQAKTDSVMEEANRLSDQAWQKALPTVMEQARNGRPYVPWASIPKHLPQAKIPAFPGAEGGGAYTPGGRGGDIYVVTSLADRGSGTFREAVEQGGARIVVFNVSGIIHLETPVNIRAPYITIAGQTAPGDGICIAGETVKITTHDVIIRHMRFRRGNTDVTRRDDALSGPVVGNVIIDHVSASWGSDESISMYRNIFDTGNEEQKLPAVNLTIQNTISSETLDIYNHSFGSTLGGLNSTFMRNLWANNVARNPSIGMWGDFTFINNVLFNWWNRSVDGGDYRSLYTILNNYYKPGPITPENKPERYRILEVQTGNVDSLAWGRAYVMGNHIVGNEKITRDNWAGGVQIDDMSHSEALKYLDYIRSEEPLFSIPENLTIMQAEKAYEFVLENVGATIPKRDEVDQRIIRQVRTGEINNSKGEVIQASEFVERRMQPDSYKQGIIVDVSQAGGYPEYNGAPYKDSDADGMPDVWEEKHGLNPQDPSDANGDISGDGYTNIEKYINGIDPTKKTDWTDPDNNYDTLAEQGRLAGN